MARRRDHSHTPARAPARPAQPLPAPVRFNAAYRRFDGWLRRRPALLAVLAMVLIAGITLVRTFPLTAGPALGAVALLTAAGLALGFATLGALGAAAAAGWIAFAGPGDKVLAWSIGIDAPPAAIAPIAAPIALFLFLSASSWWAARRHGWDLRGSFAAALAIAFALAPPA